jgi:hypothetical protein
VSDSVKAAEPPATRRPIAAVRISTVALIGIVSAVAIPAGAAALVLSGSIDEKHSPVAVQTVAPISKVVIEDSNGSVHVGGNPAMLGVSGSADLTWHGSSRPPLRLEQSVTNGVLTLRKVCLRGDCGGADIDIQVPPNVAVVATTSNAGIEVHDVGGGVDLRTTNAAISVKRLGDGDATLTTSNGSVNAGFTGAPKKITVSTSNAGVDITTDGRTPYYQSVSTSNGNQTLTNQDRYAQHEIHVDTSNGNVTIK